MFGHAKRVFDKCIGDKNGSGYDQEDNNKEELEHAFRLGEYAHPTLLDAHAAFCTVSCQGQYVPLLISFLWNKYIKAIYVNSL